MWLLAAVLCVSLLLAASGPAAATGTDGGAPPLQIGDDETNESANTTVNDTTPPEWGPAAPVNDTALSVSFYDNSSINTTGLGPRNFTVSAGSIRNVSAREVPTDDNRTRVNVTLRLSGRVNENNVTVGLDPLTGVRDTHGNERTTGNVTVTGMDTRVPQYHGFSVARVDETTVEVRLVTNESLVGIRVAVSGPVDDRLTRDDFSESVGSDVVYTAAYTFAEEGQYSFVWERASDANDNSRYMTRMRQYYYEDDAPDVSLSAPENVSVDESVTFSAANSTDEDGIEAYRWRIDGGTVLTGESIDVAFASAGVHDVVLEVTDTEGNTAVKRLRVPVTTPAGVPPAVRVTSHNDTHATASVSGTGYLQQVRTASGPLVASDRASLERVSAVVPANRTVGLDFSASDGTPESVERPGFGLFEIVHADVPADDVTVRFAVNRTALDGAGVDPAAVALYREQDGWTQLPTGVVAYETDRVVYEAASPGLSRFAVAEGEPDNGTAANATGTDETVPEAGAPENTTEPPTTPTAAPDIAVSNVTVNETAPRVGDTVAVTVTATNRGDADGSVTVDLALNDSALETRELSVPAGESRTVAFVRPVSAAGSLTVNGQQVATVGEEDRGRIAGLLGPVDGLLSSVTGLLSGLPNPLALWPGGLLGTVLAGVLGAVAVIYGILKALAIYLGY